MPHPRFYGTFPRIIDHYVRERGALPLELAIHKMTGATARALKLKDRGLLQARLSRRRRDLRSGGLPRPRHLRRPAPVPDRRAHHVIVNGVLVVENATHTGALPGHVLRRDAPARWARTPSMPGPARTDAPG